MLFVCVLCCLKDAMASDSLCNRRYISVEPLLSKFSDIFGRKWVLVSGIVMFLFGSVLCGAAQVNKQASNIPC